MKSAFLLEGLPGRIDGRTGKRKAAFAASLENFYFFMRFNKVAEYVPGVVISEVIVIFLA